MKKSCPVHYSHTLDWIEYDKEHQLNRIERMRDKLNHKMGKSIYKSLKAKNISKNRKHWESLVNFTLEELIIHLESLFQNGMNWENQGKWHIDHIKPISLFNFESINDIEFKKCWALENLQPLWAYKNRSKGNKYKESLK